MISVSKTPLKGESNSTCNPTCLAVSRGRMWLGCGGRHVNPSGPIALASIQRQWPFMSHHFFAVPHCYPLREEVALFVHGCQCQTYLKKFICISGCTQHALALSAYGMDVCWGPPADLGNKVFQRANVWLEVALNRKYVTSSMVLDFGLMSRYSLW